MALKWLLSLIHTLLMAQSTNSDLIDDVSTRRYESFVALGEQKINNHKRNKFTENFLVYF